MPLRITANSYGEIADDGLGMNCTISNITKTSLRFWNGTYTSDFATFIQLESIAATPSNITTNFTERMNEATLAQRTIFWGVEADSGGTLSPGGLCNGFIFLDAYLWS